MRKKWFSMFLIILSGEVIFMLPFLIPRLYRPLMLDAWQLSNVDIGKAFSAYGFSAMISYLLGGPLADKYSPRLLISTSLILTALGGAVLYIMPSAQMLIVIYFFFGISTIFLMWGALIKVTHLGGGEEKRSSAMGILDAGRGLSAAVMSSILVFAVASVYSEQVFRLQPEKALSLIYLIVIIVSLILSTAVFFFLDENTSDKNNMMKKWNWYHARLVLKDMNVWLLGVIVLSAYCAYKSIDNYSIFLVDVMKYDYKQSSQLTNILFWLRPLSAFVAGTYADKLQQKLKMGRLKMLITLLFAAAVFQALLVFNSIQHIVFLMILCLFVFVITKIMSLKDKKISKLNYIQSISTVLILILIFKALGTFRDGTLIYFMVSCMMLSASFAYALRAIYFSIFGNLNIPNALVGTTVGLVSFIGYLPDLFFGLLTGYFIDTYPGIVGYQYSFGFTVVMLSLGSLAALILLKRNQTLS